MALGEDTDAVPPSGRVEGLSITTHVWLDGVMEHVEGLSITTHGLAIWYILVHLQKLLTGL